MHIDDLLPSEVTYISQEGDVPADWSIVESAGDVDADFTLGPLGVGVTRFFWIRVQVN